MNIRFHHLRLRHAVGVFDRANLVPAAPMGELWFWVGHDLHKGAFGHCDESGTEVFVGKERFCVEIDAAEGSILHGKLGDMRWHATRASAAVEPR